MGGTSLVWPRVVGPGYHYGMTEHLQALLTQVLALPKSERFELLGEVLESLDSPEDVEGAWSTEIRLRLEELRAGKADVVEWADGRAAIHGSRQ